MADPGSRVFYRSLRDPRIFGVLSEGTNKSSNYEIHSRNVFSLNNEGQRLSSNYEIRTQSTRFFDNDHYDVDVINKHLRADLIGRTLEVTDRLAKALFPDEAFGFPINSGFLSNFQGSFLNTSGYLKPSNFAKDTSTSDFFNRMITTIAKFLRSTNQPPLKNIQPLRYFASLHSTKPVEGSAMKRMPDMMLVRLVDGCIRDGMLWWEDLQALVEHTIEAKPPIRMVESTIAKDYLTFCAQSERDWIINLLLTGEGFHIVIADHTGLLETDVIPFDRATSVLILVRMVIGLAFLPDDFLGIDITITCRETGRSSGRKLDEVFPPFPYFGPIPFIPLLSSLRSPLSTAKPLDVVGSTDNGLTISVSSHVYRDLQVIFEAKSFVGHATKVFLAMAPDGSRVVIKDSWVFLNRPHEATFLEGLSFPFCPTLINHSRQRNTRTLRSLAVQLSLVKEIREKRRTVTRPAGVHISDFSSLWELMVAFLDIALALVYLEEQHKLHRDLSYTNILLREPGGDAEETQCTRDNLMKQLGLSKIEVLRKQLKCREGLLIDFDYAAELVQLQEEMTSGDQEQEDEQAEDEREREHEHEEDKDKDEAQDQDASEGMKAIPHTTANLDKNITGVRTGTPPFITIELLIRSVRHRVIHDFESLFFVLLFICSHLDGPRNSIRNPPLYGGKGGSPVHPSPMRDWLIMKDLRSLGFLRHGAMIGFEDNVLPHISPYFQPLEQHLKSFWRALHPTMAEPAENAANSSAHSSANPLEVIAVFKTALLDQNLIDQAGNPQNTRNKCLLPGDLTLDGWDVVPVGMGLTDPQIGEMSKKRRTKCMTKRHQAG